MARRRARQTDGIYIGAKRAGRNFEDKYSAAALQCGAKGDDGTVLRWVILIPSRGKLQSNVALSCREAGLHAVVEGSLEGVALVELHWDTYVGSSPSMGICVVASACQKGVIQDRCRPLPAKQPWAQEVVQAYATSVRRVGRTSWPTVCVGNLRPVPGPDIISSGRKSSGD